MAHRTGKRENGAIVRRPIALSRELHLRIQEPADAEELSWNAMANRLLRGHPDVIRGVSDRPAKEVGDANA
jgi:hypothetical protein